MSETLHAGNPAKKTWPTARHHTEVDFVGRGALPMTIIIGFPDKFSKLLASKNMVVSPENFELPSIF